MGGVGQRKGLGIGMGMGMGIGIGSEEWVLYMWYMAMRPSAALL